MDFVTFDNIKQMADAGKVYADYADPNAHGRRITTTELRFQYPDGVKVIVQPGFNWDEASVPFFLQWAFPKSGKYAYPALPHDIAYYCKYWTRAEADNHFYMFSVGMNHGIFRSLLRYVGLRLFGWIVWRKKPSKYAIANRKLIMIIP